MALPDLTELHVSDTYKGVLHTANVPILGENLPPVYDGLGNQSSLRLGSDGNGASFTGTLSADSLALTGAYDHIVNVIYPIGSVIFTVGNHSPSIGFINTKWIRIAQGRFVVGVGTGNDGDDTKTFEAGDNHGKYGHVLSVSEMPQHSHNLTAQPDQSSVSFNNSVQGGSGSGWVAETTETGGGEIHENTPPGYGMYIWQRTS